MASDLNKKEDWQQLIGMSMVLFPFFKLDVLIHFIPHMNLIYTCVLMAISVFYLLYYIAYYREVDRFFIYLALFNLVMFPVSRTEMNLSIGNLMDFYGSAIYRLGFLLIICNYMKKNPKLLLKALSLVMSLIVLANVFSIIIFPQGLYTTGEGLALNRYWILGYDNAHAVMYIYCMMLVMLSRYMNTGKVRSVWICILYLLCLYVSISLWTATSILAMLVLGIFLLMPTIFQRFSKVSNMFVFSLVIAFMCWVCISLAVSSGTDNRGIVATILKTVLNKDITFNSRTMIWENYLVNIKQFPIFGNGCETAEIMFAKNRANGAHNEWIQILYFGGIVHLIFYFAILVSTVKRLFVNRNKMGAQIVSFSIFAMMVIQLMRGCPEIYWLSMFAIGYYIESIEKCACENDLCVRCNDG